MMNSFIQIPSCVKFIVATLQDNGFESYLVGGCVRDMFLGRDIHDWDICTAAEPDDVINIFDKPPYKIIKTGLKHGTVTLVLPEDTCDTNNNMFEITTFRIDGNYSDGRHPDSVEFTKSIDEDLKRRDFTMNAIAYDPISCKIYDPFDGVFDIYNKLIKCVGNPSDRFTEDPLRVLRAFRFQCQLDFNIEFLTMMNATVHLPELNNSVSKERINSEFVKSLKSAKIFVEKTLASDQLFLTSIIPEFSEMNIYQNNPHHIYSIDIHSLCALSCIDNECDDTILKLSVLLHDIGKPRTLTTDDDWIMHFYKHAEVSCQMAKDILTRLRFDNDTINKVVELIRYHDAELHPNKKSAKKWLNRLGEEQLKRLTLVKLADWQGQNPDFFDERYEVLCKFRDITISVLSEKEPYSLSMLAINGHDLLDMGVAQGKEIGIILKSLLESVVDEEIPNDKDILLEEARRYLKNS